MFAVDVDVGGEVCDRPRSKQHEEDDKKPSIARRRSLGELEGHLQVAVSSDSYQNLMI